MNYTSSLVITPVSCDSLDMYILKGNSHDFQVSVRYKSLAHKALSKRFYIFTWLLYCRSSAERKGRG